MLPPCLDRGELTVGHRPAWSSCDGRHGGLDVVTVVAVHEVVARVGQRYLPGAAVAFTRMQKPATLGGTASRVSLPSRRVTLDFYASA